MGVICNHCIELHNTKAFFLCLCKAVKNQFLANVFTTEISSYCIAGITDMSASSYIVRASSSACTTMMTSIDAAKSKIRRRSSSLSTSILPVDEPMKSFMPGMMR